MELDDLKVAWRALDERVAAVQTLNLNILKDRKLEGTRVALRPLRWQLLIELALAVAAVLLNGAFLGAHWRDARFAIPAVALHAVAVLMIASAAAQLALLRAADYSAPVVTIQRTLTKLAALRIRTTQWLLLLAPLLWTPLAIVVARGALGFDVYRWFGMRWVAANLVFGVALSPLLFWAARRFSDRLQQFWITESLADGVAGRSLSIANGLLDEIVRFGQEDGRAASD